MTISPAFGVKSATLAGTVQFCATPVSITAWINPAVTNGSPTSNAFRYAVIAAVHDAYASSNAHPAFGFT